MLCFALHWYEAVTQSRTCAEPNEEDMGVGNTMLAYDIGGRWTTPKMMAMFWLFTVRCGSVTELKGEGSSTRLSTQSVAHERRGEPFGYCGHTASPFYRCNCHAIWRVVWELRVSEISKTITMMSVGVKVLIISAGQFGLIFWLPEFETHEILARPPPIYHVARLVLWVIFDLWSQDDYPTSHFYQAACFTHQVWCKIGCMDRTRLSLLQDDASEQNLSCNGPRVCTSARSHLSVIAWQVV